jgi:hypothetical protein
VPYPKHSVRLLLLFDIARSKVIVYRLFALTFFHVELAAFYSIVYAWPSLALREFGVL